jgi:hypothetical protein
MERIPTEPDVDPVSSVGSSHNRLTSAEDNAEALRPGAVKWELQARKTDSADRRRYGRLLRIIPENRKHAE